MIKPKRMFRKILNKNNLRALYGGLIAAFLTGSVIYLLGNLNAWQAKTLIESSVPSLSMLCNTIALASATIIALLLTLLGVSSRSHEKLNEDHYKQVILIARWSVVVFSAAIICMQLFNMPITDTKQLDYHLFKWIYWTYLGIASILSGAMVTIVLLLYNTIKNLIHIIGFDTE